MIVTPPWPCNQEWGNNGVLRPFLSLVASLELGIVTRWRRLREQYSPPLRTATCNSSSFSHVLAAIIWVGGSAFIAFALIPGLKGEDPATRSDLLRKTAGRFRVIGWAALLVAIGTGVYLAVTGGHMKSPWIHAKMGLVTLLLVASALHDWYIGPKLGALVRAGEDPGLYRKLAMILGQVSFVLALVIVYCGVRIVHP